MKLGLCLIIACLLATGLAQDVTETGSPTEITTLLASTEESSPAGTTVPTLETTSSVVVTSQQATEVDVSTTTSEQSQTTRVPPGTSPVQETATTGTTHHESAGTTTVASHNSTSLENTTLTPGTTIPVLESSTTSAAGTPTTADSTASLSTDPSAAVTTTSIDSGTTTTQKRSTTFVYHECVTSAPCVDPNSHCVNRAGRNTCECKLGYKRNFPAGRCHLIEVTTTSTSTTPIPTTETEPTTQIHTTPATSIHSKNDVTRLASHLTKEEKMNVVSIILTPASSVVEWLLLHDMTFRNTVASILTMTSISMQEEPEASVLLNVTANQVLYVAPSPLMTLDGVLVSFLIRDINNIAPKHLSSSGKIIARHRRDTNKSTGYIPALWVVTALRNSQFLLERALNQTVSTLYGGIIPNQLYSIEQFAASNLFERRLDIFIPLILVAALCILGLAVSLACIRAKTKSMADWDPPAGVIFGKTSLKKEEREDPQGSVSKADAMGHHLATDEQCRDGEEQLVKHSTHINTDDDAWVVPYDEGPSPGQPVNHVKTQFEDTKL